MTVLDTLGVLYRIARVLIFVVLVAAIVLILRPDTPPEIVEDEDAVERLARKVSHLEQTAGTGQPAELRLDEPELNGWMRTNLEAAATDPPASEEAPSNVRDIKIKMDGDRVRAYVVFQMGGKDLSVTLDGRIAVRDGYLELDPSAMKVGSLPIPQATLESAVQRLFESTENREQFRVPANVRDIRVENGTLIVSY